MPVITTEYPKFIQIEGQSVLINSEEEFDEIESNAERQMMMSELAAAGKKVDGRRFKGATGLGALYAYYEAVIGDKPKQSEATNDSSDDDS